MKSPLEIEPNKLVGIAFAIALLILPAMLIFTGFNINPKIYGISAGILLIIFFFFIYPRVSKNKSYVAQLEEDKKASVIIRQQPDLFKVRIAALISLLAIVVVSAYLIFKKQADSIIYTVPVIVFLFMTYYARWMKKKQGLQAYASKLEEVEVKGITNAAKWSFYGLLIGIVTSVIMAIVFFTTLRR